MAKNKFAVIFACDHNYIWFALNAANSLVRNSDNANFDTRIFSCTFVPDGFDEHCDPRVSAETISMGDFVPSTGFTQRHSIATFARIFAIEKVAKEYDRIIYLDADIAFQHGDISIFWDIDLKDHPIAGVRSPSSWGANSPKTQRYYSNLSPKIVNGQYYNTGFLLLDCNVWKTEGIFDKIVSFLEEFPELCRYHDQSAFNAVFAGRWAEISYLWNWQISNLLNAFLIRTRDPHIIHFNHQVKPWRDPKRLLEPEYKRSLMNLSEAAGLDIFDGWFQRGSMSSKNESNYVRRMADNYNRLPEYLAAITPYLDREDFIDFEGKEIDA